MKDASHILYDSQMDTYRWCLCWMQKFNNVLVQSYFAFLFISFLLSSHYCKLFCVHFTLCSAPMAFERRNFYRAIPAMIQNLGCHGLVPVTAQFSQLLITTSQVYWRPYSNPDPIWFHYLCHYYFTPFMKYFLRFNNVCQGTLDCSLAIQTSANLIYIHSGGLILCSSEYEEIAGL